MKHVPLDTARGNVTDLPGTAKRRHLRILEALLFAAAEPLDEASLAERLPADADLPALLADLRAAYAERGVNVTQVAGGWVLRTAEDLAPYLRRHVTEPRRLSRAALETLAIIVYHQPVTRAEIEAVRGVSISKATLDLLLETGWVRMRGRRRSPGRPVTYGTTPGFLSHFGLDSLSHLPGLEEFQAAGLIGPGLATDFRIPMPDQDSLEAEAEDPLDEDEPLRDD
jgi:segregation and condensation protein B